MPYLFTFESQLIKPNSKTQFIVPFPIKLLKLLKEFEHAGDGFGVADHSILVETIKDHFEGSIFVTGYTNPEKKMMELQ